MNKETFSLILNGAMLNYIDGVDVNTLVNEMGYDPKIAQIGVKLSMYLSGLRVGGELTK
jgi:hypothetical protein